MVGKLRHGLVAFLGDHNGDGAAGADFLDVGYHLGVQGFPTGGGGHDDEHRLAFFNQGDGAVLELTGGEAFGVQVGDFLEFQCAFQGHRVADMTAEEKYRAGFLHVAAELLDLFFVVNNFLDLVGNLAKFLKGCVDLVGEHVAAKLRKV